MKHGINPRDDDFRPTPAILRKLRQIDRESAERAALDSPADPRIGAEHDGGTPARDGEALSPALLLDLFAEPIMFRRAYVGVTGSVTAALWLSNVVSRAEELSYAARDAADGATGTDTESHIAAAGPFDRGWFERSAELIEDDTGLSRFEQVTARRCLREQGILHERRIGMPARLQFWVDHERLGSLLKEAAETRWGSSLG